jgi:hypothetical protein
MWKPIETILFFGISIRLDLEFSPYAKRDIKLYGGANTRPGIWRHNGLL